MSCSLLKQFGLTALFNGPLAVLAETTDPLPTSLLTAGIHPPVRASGQSQNSLLIRLCLWANTALLAEEAPYSRSICLKYTDVNIKRQLTVADKVFTDGLKVY